MFPCCLAVFFLPLVLLLNCLLLIAPRIESYRTFSVAMFPLKNRLIWNCGGKVCATSSSSSRLFSSTQVEVPSTQSRPRRKVDAAFYHIPLQEPNEKIQYLVERRMANVENFEANQHMRADSDRVFHRAVHFVDQFYHQKGMKEGKATDKFVILDSGCGRGMSTIKLAQRFPDVPVIGLDRSRSRLMSSIHYTPTAGSDHPRDLPENRWKHLEKNKTKKSKEHGDDDDDEDDDDDDEEAVEELDNELQLARLQREPTPPNALLLHTELSEIWRLIFEKSDWIIQKHFLLHPNPYPRQSLMKKRLYVHPSVVHFLGLGGDLVVHNNWAVYSQELFLAISTVKQRLTGRAVSKEEITTKMQRCVQEINTSEPLTHFEMKYSRLGIPVYGCTIALGQRDRAERELFMKAVKIACVDNPQVVVEDAEERARMSKVVKEFALDV